jgi:methylated-DNA-[protein]-cysteine S-methyltransferase
VEQFLYLPSPVGTLTLTQEGSALTGLRFGQLSCQGVEGPTPLLEKTAQQLAEYFAGERREFSLPLAPKGTDFQRRVWQALLTIPYGETRTYGELAALVGNPRACRAVGGANHRNPISILIPCHRVVGTKGALTGYAGGLAVKEFLLKLEAGRHP